MNNSLVLAGVLGALATMGHFGVGYKRFLKPVLRANIDPVAVKVMSSLFHYMSVFMVLTTVLLLAFGFGDPLFFRSPNDVVWLIGACYTGFALVQFLIALTSSIPAGIFKLFQWIFWALIAAFCFLGIS